MPLIYLYLILIAFSIYLINKKPDKKEAQSVVVEEVQDVSNLTKLKTVILHEGDNNINITFPVVLVLNYSHKKKKDYYIDRQLILLFHPLEGSYTFFKDKPFSIKIYSPTGAPCHLETWLDIYKSE